MTKSFTKRETEVADLLVRGKAAYEIADALCISRHTSRDHIRSLMRKTGARSRVDLMRTLGGLPQVFDVPRQFDNTDSALVALHLSGGGVVKRPLFARIPMPGADGNPYLANMRRTRGWYALIEPTGNHAIGIASAAFDVALPVAVARIPALALAVLTDTAGNVAAVALPRE